MKTWFSKDSKFKVSFKTSGYATKGFIHIEDNKGEFKQFALIYFPSRHDCVNRTIQVIDELLNIKNIAEKGDISNVIERAKKRED